MALKTQTKSYGVSKDESGNGRGGFSNSYTHITGGQYGTELDVHKLWGQNFNGKQDIDGSIDINEGNLTIQEGKVEVHTTTILDNGQEESWVTEVAGDRITINGKRVLTEEDAGNYVSYDKNGDVNITGNEFIAKNLYVDNINSNKTQNVTFDTDVIIGNHVTGDRRNGTPSNLDVTGNLTVNGVTNTNGLNSSNNVNVEGNITATGDLSGQNLNISGDITADTIKTNDIQPADSTKPIVMNGSVEINNNITVKGKSEFEGDVDINGRLNASSITTSNLTVSGEAHFFKLIIDEVKSAGGQLILSPADFTVDYIDTNIYKQDDINLRTMRVCQKATNSEGRVIENKWEIGDHAYCQTFNIKEGTHENVSNTYFWSRVTEVGTCTIDDIDYIYIDIENPNNNKALYKGNTTNSDGSYTIQVGDSIVLLGSDNVSRQKAIIISAYQNPDVENGNIGVPAIVQYSGISGYSLKDKIVTKIAPSGNLFKGQLLVESGQSVEDLVNGVDTQQPMHIYTAYAESVYDDDIVGFTLGDDISRHDNFSWIGICTSYDSTAPTDWKKYTWTLINPPVEVDIPDAVNYSQFKAVATIKSANVDASDRLHFMYQVRVFIATQLGQIYQLGETYTETEDETYAFGFKYVTDKDGNEVMLNYRYNEELRDGYWEADYTLENYHEDANQPDLFEIHFYVNGRLQNSYTDIVPVKFSAGAIFQVVDDRITSKVQDIEGRLSTVEQTAESIKHAVYDPDGSFSELSQTVGGFDARIQQNENNYTTLSARVDGISAQVTGVEGGVVYSSEFNVFKDGIESRVSTAEGNISSIQQKVDNITLNVQNNNDEIGNLQIKADSIAAQVKNNTGDIGTLKLTANRFSTQISNINTKINELNTTIAENKSSIEQTANKISQTVESLESTVKGNGTNIENVTKRVGQLELKADSFTSTISTIQNGLTTAQSKITQHDSDISLLASQVQENTNNIASIDLKADSISSQVAKYVQVGGVNFIKNADFRKGSEGFNVLGEGLLEDDSVEGENCLHIIQNKNDNLFSFKPTIQLHAGQKYNFMMSGDVYVVKYATYNPVINWTDPQLWTIYCADNKLAKVLGSIPKFSLDKSKLNTWQHFEMLWTVEITEDYPDPYIYLSLRPDGKYSDGQNGRNALATGGEFYFKHLQLEQGTLATSFKPAEDDLLESMSEIRQTSNSIEAAVYDNLKNKTGIDIETGKITLNATNTIVDGTLNITDAGSGIVIYDNDNNPRVNIQQRAVGSINNLASDARGNKSGTYSFYKWDEKVAYDYKLPTFELGTVNVNDVVDLYCMEADNAFAFSISATGYNSKGVRVTNYPRWTGTIKIVFKIGGEQVYITSFSKTLNQNRVPNYQESWTWLPTDLQNGLKCTKSGKLTLEITFSQTKTQHESSLNEAQKYDANGNVVSTFMSLDTDIQLNIYADVCWKKTVTSTTLLGTDGMYMSKGIRKMFYFGDDGFQVEYNNQGAGDLATGIKIDNTTPKTVYYDDGTGASGRLWGAMTSIKTGYNNVIFANQHKSNRHIQNIGQNNYVWYQPGPEDEFIRLDATSVSNTFQGYYGYFVLILPTVYTLPNGSTCNVPFGKKYYVKCTGVKGVMVTTDQAGNRIINADSSTLKDKIDRGNRFMIYIYDGTNWCEGYCG